MELAALLIAIYDGRLDMFNTPKRGRDRSGALNSPTPYIDFPGDELTANMTGSHSMQIVVEHVLKRKRPRIAFPKAE